MTGIDTSFLLPMAMQEHSLHTEARRLAALNTDGFAVVPLVLSEFIHCSSDPKRFAQPLTVVQALDWTDALLDLPNVRLVVPNTSALRLWLKWMRTHRLGRKRTLDTQLAATLHQVGVKRLLTANPRDFRIFNVFELITPFVSSNS